MSDLIAMLRRRSSAGMNPGMAAIMGSFQILGVYYGLLIASRPVIAWNVIGVVVNCLSVGAYLHFVCKEKDHLRMSLRVDARPCASLWSDEPLSLKKMGLRGRFFPGFPADVITQDLFEEF
jgi:hypothetical protein